MRIGIDENSGSYIFTPGIAGAGTIQLIGLSPITLNQLQIIYNVTDGLPLFNFASSTLTASIDNNVVTLSTNTSSMSASDSLLIQVADKADGVKMGSLFMLLMRIYNYITNLPWVDKGANQARVQATISSGTVTTVTTCSTVTNVAQLAGYTAEMLVRNQNVASWYVGVRGRIS